MNEIRTLSDLVPDDLNANKGTERGQAMLERSLRDYGAGRSVLADKNGRLIAGNKTVETAREIGLQEVIVVPTDGTQIVVVQRTDLDLQTDPRARELGLADNRVGEVNLCWDDEAVSRMIAEGVEVKEFWNDDELKAFLEDTSTTAQNGTATRPVEEARQTLAQRFGVPPFSVLDARQGYWQERKNAWLAMGLRSFEGRGQHLTYDDAGAKPPAFYALRNEMRDLAGGVDPSWDEINAEAGRRGMMSAAIEGTSIFDPVLCELCYRWFCPPTGTILDPFAGGSVRGVVASTLGRSYTGIDLRQEQITANEVNWAQWPQQAGPRPVWLQGDSTRLDQLVGVPDEESIDFVFSCPPYADLEVYSDDPRDLSNMSYRDFLSAYETAIAHSVARLKEDRFACFVVGDVRDSRGNYRGFVADTMQAFADAGACFYNDAVLLTQIGSGAIRAGRQFENSRKLCKTHQNVLVFVKGDAKRATEALGACEWGQIADPAEEFGEVVS